MSKKKRSGDKKNARLKWQVLSIAIDLLSINLAIVASFLIRFFGRLPSFNFNAYLDLAAYITVIFAIIYYIHDLYDVERYFDLSGTIARILQANFIGIIVVISLSFVLRVFAFPRSVFVISYFFSSLLVVLSRFIVTKLFYLELPSERILIIGSKNMIEKIEDELSMRSHLGLKHAGSIEIGEDESEDAALKKVSERISQLKPDRVILAGTNHSRSFLFRLSEILPVNIRFQMVPDIYESLFGRQNFETLSDIPLLDVGKPPDTAWTKFGKRAFDIIVSLIFLAFLFPLFLIIALAIKLDSKGPVFYRQKRVGYLGTEFWCIKFRTMVEDAEKLTGPVLAEKEDPRITRVGKILRKYRIDELPQLINILKGEMSLVGPRPERPEFCREFEKEIPFYRYRYLVRPGATGLAQIYGRYETDAYNKLKYDLVYIFNLSFFLDVLILLKTLNIVFTGKGAR